MTTAALETHPRDRWRSIRFSLLALTAPKDSWENGWSYSNPTQINRLANPTAAAFLDLLRHWTETRLQGGAKNLWLTESMEVIQGCLYGVATSENTIRKAIALLESKGYISVQRSTHEPLRFLLRWEKVATDVRALFAAEQKPQPKNASPSKMSPRESDSQKGFDGFEDPFFCDQPLSSEPQPSKDSSPPSNLKSYPLIFDDKEESLLQESLEDKNNTACAYAREGSDRTAREVVAILDSEPEPDRSSFAVPSEKAIAVTTIQTPGEGHSASRRLNARSDIQPLPAYLENFEARWQGKLSQPTNYARPLERGESLSDGSRTMQDFRGRYFEVDERLLIGMVYGAESFYDFSQDVIDLEGIPRYFSRENQSLEGRGKLESYWRSGVNLFPERVSATELPEVIRKVAWERHRSKVRSLPGAPQKAAYSQRLGSPQRQLEVREAIKTARDRRTALASAR